MTRQANNKREGLDLWLARRLLNIHSQLAPTRNHLTAILTLLTIHYIYCSYWPHFQGYVFNSETIRPPLSWRSSNKQSLYLLYSGYISYCREAAIQSNYPSGLSARVYTLEICPLHDGMLLWLTLVISVTIISLFVPGKPLRAELLQVFPLSVPSHHPQE